jgi:hypothetical protein
MVSRPREGTLEEGTRRDHPQRNRRSQGGTVALSVVAGLLVLLAGGLWLGLSSPQGGEHPAPRPDVTGATVIPAERFADYTRVSAVYAQAAEIPHILDGLHCYCDCAQHSGHRSLLTCFESDHAAPCDISLTEAAIAYRMTREGRSLDEIRAAIDELYGS